MFKTFLVFLQCRPLRHRPSACGLWPPRRHIHNGKTFTHVLSLAYMNLANSNLQSETRQQVDVLNDVIIMPSTPKNAVGLLPRAWSLLCGAAIYSASAWGLCSCSFYCKGNARAYMRGTGDGSLRAFCYRMYLPHPTNTENSPSSWRHKGTRV